VLHPRQKIRHCTPRVPVSSSPVFLSQVWLTCRDPLVTRKLVIGRVDSTDTCTKIRKVLVYQISYKPSYNTKHQKNILISDLVTYQISDKKIHHFQTSKCPTSSNPPKMKSLQHPATTTLPCVGSKIPISPGSVRTVLHMVSKVYFHSLYPSHNSH
jgi:hypothetical protein